MLKYISDAGEPAIDVAGLVKSFGAVTALDGVDLRVELGSLTALLGLNGAGKTTLVRVVATLSRPDAGRVRVLGFDAVREARQVRARIGLTGQYAGLDEVLTGRDNLVLIGRLAGLRRSLAAERAAELSAIFGLAAAISRPVRTYSGGMRRRLDLAASLMTRPELLILDEPTTGLDPASRSQLWVALAELRAAGTTMLLTSQYLEEVDRFADMVHVLQRGKIIASGTAASLKAQVGGSVIEVILSKPTAVPGAVAVLERRLSLPVGGLHAQAQAGRLTLIAEQGVQTLVAVANVLRDDGIDVADLAVRQPSLDEAFLALTGSAQSGSVQSGSAQSGSAQAGSAQAGSAQSGSVQAGSAQSGGAAGTGR